MCQYFLSFCFLFFFSLVFIVYVFFLSLCFPFCFKWIKVFGFSLNSYTHTACFYFLLLCVFLFTNNISLLLDSWNYIFISLMFSRALCVYKCVWVCVCVGVCVLCSCILQLFASKMQKTHLDSICILFITINIFIII